MKNKKIIASFLILSLSSFLFSIGQSTWHFFSSTGETKETTINKNDGKKVCYIKDEPSVYYTSIEKALDVASTKANQNSPQTVVVIPSVNSKDKTTPTVFINDDIKTKDSEGNYDNTVTIGSYVSLTIACTEDEAENGKYGKNRDDSKCAGFADSEETYDTYIRSNIGLAENVILKINPNGSLNIGGTTGTGYSQQRPTGHTNGDFCQLTMYNNSKIDCEGNIDLYGYIKESSSNNGSQVIANTNGNISLPFVFYDYRGGTYSSMAISHAFPFNIYDFPNIQSELIVKKKSIVSGRVCVNALGNLKKVTATAVGEGGLFVLADNSEISWKYKSPSSKYSYLYDTEREKNGDKISKTIVKVNSGTLNLSFMILKISTLIKIDTSDFLFPLCYKYEVIVKDGCALNINNKAKFYFGSSLKIEKGATVNLNADTIFYQKYKNQNVSANIKDTSFYPQELDSAKLINNGTLKIHGIHFGGFIYNELEGAEIIVENATLNIESKEIYNNKGGLFGKSIQTKTITGYGVGYISSNSDETSKVTRVFVKNSTYISNSNGIWIGNATGSTSNTETIK